MMEGKQKWEKKTEVSNWLQLKFITLEILQNICLGEHIAGALTGPWKIPVHVKNHTT